MFGFRRIVLIGAVLAVGVGGAKLRAQTQLADPKDAPRIFATTCSACHKSPQGLAKSGQVAGFLRQHYTTGPEMSAAMAAYLVAAGAAPAPKKKEVAAEGATKQKSKKELLSAAQPNIGTGETERPRTLRGKQQQAKAAEEQAPRPAAQQPPASPTADEPQRQAATPAVTNAVPSEPAAAVAVPPQPAGPPPVVLDIPLPPMPDAPPPELTQSVFSTSPLP